MHFVRCKGSPAESLPGYLSVQFSHRLNISPHGPEPNFLHIGQSSLSSTSISVDVRSPVLIPRPLLMPLLVIVGIVEPKTGGLFRRLLGGVCCGSERQ